MALTMSITQWAKYGNEVHVSGTGKGDYTTINAAIAAASQVATAQAPVVIVIHEGTYAEEVVLASNIYLCGVNREACIIDSSAGAVSGSLVTNAGVTGLTIDDDYGEAIVTLESCDGIKIRDCIMRGVGSDDWAVSMDTCTDILIENCEMYVGNAIALVNNCQRCTARSNYIEAIGAPTNMCWSAVDMTGTSNRFTHNTVKLNDTAEDDATNYAYGVRINSFGGNIISHNDIYIESNRESAYAIMLATPVSTDAPTEVDVISHNTIRMICSHATPEMYASIRIDSADVTYRLPDAVITDNEIYITGLTPSVAHYAVYVTELNNNPATLYIDRKSLGNSRLFANKDVTIVLQDSKPVRKRPVSQVFRQFPTPETLLASLSLATINTVTAGITSPSFPRNAVVTGSVGASGTVRLWGKVRGIERYEDIVVVAETEVSGVLPWDSVHQVESLSAGAGTAVIGYGLRAGLLYPIEADADVKGLGYGDGSVGRVALVDIPGGSVDETNGTINLTTLWMADYDVEVYYETNCID